MKKDDWLASIADIVKRMDEYEERIRCDSKILHPHDILLAIDKLQTGTNDAHALHLLGKIRANIKKPLIENFTFMSVAMCFYAAGNDLESLSNYIQQREDLFP